jgi:hydroxyproline O-arabinosyltransferase
LLSVLNPIEVGDPGRSRVIQETFEESGNQSSWCSQIRMLSYRTVGLLIPFAVITWMQWLGSVQRDHHEQRQRSATPSRAQRDRMLSERARQRWLQREPLAKLAVADPVTEAPTTDPPPTDPLPTDPPSAEATAAAKPACPENRRPYHVLLTSTVQVYQQWQCRVMYYHWKKQRDLDPAGACTEMTGFSRLVATPDGRPDGIEDEIPSIFVKEYTARELGKFGGYRVINRPYSVVQLLEKRAAWDAIQEDYVYIAETDHILMHPIPNKASC